MESRREKGHTPWNKGKSKCPQLNDRAWLYRKYWEEELNTYEIADIVSCGETAVLNALKRHNIKRRTSSEGLLNKNPILNNKEWLNQKYWVEKLNSFQIAEIVGCNSHQTVLNALNRLNIPRRNLSESLKGIKRSEKTKRKMAKSKEGKNNPFFHKHHSEETKQKIREARKHQPTHHTKPELIFEEICKKYKLPFKYTGNGDFWIHNINPDFIECNGKKIVVEIFGDYWHSPLLQWDLREDRTLHYRKRILKKYGWKLIVFWETDLKRQDAEAFVLSVLK